MLRETNQQMNKQKSTILSLYLTLCFYSYQNYLFHGSFLYSVSQTTSDLCEISGSHGGKHEV
jgi:hypothetical protein